MITELEAKKAAEMLVGEDVMPRLFKIEGVALKSTELPEDRFACNDDGYYLLNAGLKIPTKAIIDIFDLGDSTILDLDKYSVIMGN